MMSFKFIFRRFMQFQFLAFMLCHGQFHFSHAQENTQKKALPESKTSVPVGMVGKINQIVIPGGELEAIADTDPRAKIVVRVAETFRHGDAFRYDLEFTGFEPGRYDLSKNLKRKNPAETTANISPIEIEITSSLEAGKIEPTRPEQPIIADWLKYFTKLDTFVVIWLIGLAILWKGAKNRNTINKSEERQPLTLAERLKPLVQAACEGRIEPNRRAELESLLIAYWTDQLQFGDEIAPARILTSLKSHAEAGPLFLKLEEWLHMPPGERTASDDEIALLLKPYETVADGSLMKTKAGKGLKNHE
jgi:hypothetical protein